MWVIDLGKWGICCLRCTKMVRTGYTKYISRIGMVKFEINDVSALWCFTSRDNLRIPVSCFGKWKRMKIFITNIGPNLMQAHIIYVLNPKTVLIQNLNKVVILTHIYICNSIKLINGPRMCAVLLLWIVVIIFVQRCTMWQWTPAEDHSSLKP